jgi:hypothetical protein
MSIVTLDYSLSFGLRRNFDNCFDMKPLVTDPYKKIIIMFHSQLILKSSSTFAGVYSLRRMMTCLGSAPRIFAFSMNMLL